jgi:hypothetical protein
VIVAKFLSLLLLLFGTYLTGLSLLPGRQRPEGIAETALYFALGLVLVALLFLGSKITHLPWYSTLVAVAVLSVKTLYLKQHRVQPTREFGIGELLGASVMALTAMLPILIMGFYMAVGTYPTVFFAVDSPYFLHHVHALMTTSEFPPPSFELWGFAWKYHYGTQALVALLSKASGLAPHTLMFGIVVPLLQFLAFFLAYLIIAALIRGRFARYLLFAVILMGSKHHVLSYSDGDLLDQILQVERYHFRYAHPPSVFGMVMVMAILYSVLNYQQHRLRIVATAMVGLIPVVKVPYALFTGCGYAAFLFVEYLRSRKAALMAHLLGAGALCILSYYIFAAAPYAVSGIAKVQAFGFLSMMTSWQILTVSVYFVLTLLLTALTRTVRINSQQISLGLFVLAIFVLFLPLELQSRDAVQVFDPVIAPAILLLLSIGLNNCAEGRDRGWYCRAYFGALSIAVIPGAISLAGHTNLLITKPEAGHEYVSNISLGEVLSRIPTHGTLIATNDLRYPAQGFEREGRQLQFAGIFGHRNLGSNFIYIGVPDEDKAGLVKLRETINRLFAGTQWSPEGVKALREKYPITHFVVHKRYPYPEEIPLERIYENVDYVAYRF